MVSGVDLLAAAPIVIAASSQASNRLLSLPFSFAVGPISAGGPATVVGVPRRPGIVPVFISDWYIAAFSGDASMVEPS